MLINSFKNTQNQTLKFQVTRECDTTIVPLLTVIIVASVSSENSSRKSLDFGKLTRYIYILKHRLASGNSKVQT